MLGCKWFIWLVNVAKASHKNFFSGSKIPPNLIKSYTDESEEGYFFEIDVQYLEKSY